MIGKIRRTFSYLFTVNELRERHNRPLERRAVPRPVQRSMRRARFVCDLFTGMEWGHDFLIHETGDDQHRRESEAPAEPCPRERAVPSARGELMRRRAAAGRDGAVAAAQ
jgi:hypothetical protein